MSGQDDYTFYIDNGTGASAHTNDLTLTNYTTDVYRDTITIGGSQEPERSENMRSLFRITVVNPKTGTIYPEVKVIAQDRETALLKANLSKEVRANPDDFDLLVECVGSVRAKKDVQKVKVVKDDDA